MSNPAIRFPFIDSVHAAEILHVSQDAVLDWIAAGKLRPFGGKATNPFLRSVDVQALREELGVSDEEAPKRMKSASARVQQRLTADARWSEISDDEIGDWATRADNARRQAARTAAREARDKLATVLRVLDEDR